MKCQLTTQRSANNIYTPLIVGGVLLLILFLACIIAQRMKFIDYLINVKNRCFKRAPPQDSTHSYDLQQCTPAVTIDTMNVVEANPIMTKLPPIHKISNVIVPRSKRLLSLDAFRGFSKKKKIEFFTFYHFVSFFLLALIAMIFVNYGGGGYAQFDHSPWHGITFADIVFPFFVWMLGTSLVFSLKNAIDKGVSKRVLLKKIAIRTLKLFVRLF